MSDGILMAGVVFGALLILVGMALGHRATRGSLRPDSQAFAAAAATVVVGLLLEVTAGLALTGWL